MQPSSGALSTIVFPFNFTVPGQSKNDLIDLKQLAEALGTDPNAKLPEDEDVPPVNEFSGATYKVINVVADMPLRVPPAILAQRTQAEDLGRADAHRLVNR